MEGGGGKQPEDAGDAVAAIRSRSFTTGPTSLVLPKEKWRKKI